MVVLVPSRVTNYYRKVLKYISRISIQVSEVTSKVRARMRIVSIAAGKTGFTQTAFVCKLSMHILALIARCHRIRLTRLNIICCAELLID